MKATLVRCTAAFERLDLWYGVRRCRLRNTRRLPVPSIYSSARTELAKLLIYGLFRKIRVLAQDHGSSLSESRVSAFPRFPGSKGLPGTPSPAGLFLLSSKKAAQVCRGFNHTRIAGFAAEELPS